MIDQFGNYVGPGFVGGGGQTVNDLPSYDQTQQDMGAIRQLMGQQGAGYMVTGNASMADGGNSAAYLPGMMHQAGIAPTQGILNSYQQITGQQWNPGDTVTGYNNFGTGGNYGIRGANGQTTQSAMTGYGGFAGKPAQSFSTKPAAYGDTFSTKPDLFGQTNTKAPMQMGGGSAPSQPGQPGGMGSNPYLPQMGDVMAGQMAQNFNRRVMPQIGSQMMAAGGFGGSRQGVIEANAMNDLNQQIGNSLTNLYGQGYNTDRQYDLGLRGNELGWGNLGLGWGNLGLGYSNLDRNINNDNLNWQMQGANLGMTMQDRMLAQMQAALGLGTNIQNTPYNYWSQFANQNNAIGNNFASGNTSINQPGSALGGALGGAQLGSRLGNWWNAQSNGFNYQPSNNGYSYTYRNPETVGPPISAI